MTTRQSRRDTDGQTQDHLGERTAEYQTKDVSALGAERHAEANLADPSGDRVGRDAVEAHAGQCERQQAEKLGEPRDQPLPVEIPRHLLAEAHHAEHGQIWINIGQSAADGRFQARGRPHDAQLDVMDVNRAIMALSGCGLQQRQEDGSVSGPARVLILRVLDNTDDFIVPAMTRISQSEVLPNGVFIVKELAGESLVDDGDVLGSGRVALLDGAPSQEARTDSLKVMGADPIPRGRRSLEVRRVAFDVRALVPVVASQRTVA